MNDRKIPLEFEDLFRAGEPEAFTGTKLDESTIDPENFEGAMTGGAQFEKLFGRDRPKPAGFGWDEIVSQPLGKTEKAKDGMTEEKSGAQTWRYFTKDGACYRMELEDPELEGGKMLFDGEGNEIAA